MNFGAFYNILTKLNLKKFGYKMKLHMFYSFFFSDGDLIFTYNMENEYIRLKLFCITHETREFWCLLSTDKRTDVWSRDFNVGYGLGWTVK